MSVSDIHSVFKTRASKFLSPSKSVQAIARTDLLGDKNFEARVLKTQRAFV